ncbi:MAG: sigma-70 family RNA polymerase sigma factor [Bacteroidota bacterium]
MASQASELLSILSDEELIKRFQRGDERAFTQLVNRFKDPLTNYVYRFLGELDRANDVVQETFLRLYHYRHSYTRDAKFATWLYKVASNVTKSELRREYVSRRYLVHGISGDADNDWEGDAFLDPDLTPEAQVDSSLKMRLVQQALMQISAAYREVVILRDIQQMSYEEITEITGLGLGTVKSRINRGRAQLQTLLRDIYQEDGDVTHS